MLTLDGKLDPQNPSKEVPTLGYIVLEVDALLESGGPKHRELMSKLEKRLRFGKVVSLQESEGGSGYAGRRIKQHPDFSFTYSMDDYVTNRLHPVKVHRYTLKKNAAETPLNEDEISQLRGTIAAINWPAREGRPDGVSECFDTFWMLSDSKHEASFGLQPGGGLAEGPENHHQDSPRP